jgi:hypothetical protein
MIAEFLDVPVQYFFEGLDVDASPRTTAGASGERNTELVALNDAFRSITDPDTRRSVVALVCSLAAADPETPASRPISGMPRAQDTGSSPRPR